MNITYASNVSSVSNTLFLERNTFRSHPAIKLSTYKLENKVCNYVQENLIIGIKIVD